MPSKHDCRLPLTASPSQPPLACRLSVLSSSLMPPDRKWMPGTEGGMLQSRTGRQAEESQNTHTPPSVQSSGKTPRPSQLAALLKPGQARHITCAAWSAWCTSPRQRARPAGHPGLQEEPERSGRAGRAQPVH